MTTTESPVISTIILVGGKRICFTDSVFALSNYFTPLSNFLTSVAK
ncbi:hypothetical protein PRABACTJOHN_01241 [Parabacteroides johnsonii DSM 18315]|uniref:Uncharacterized protein n=1 Tax=Parabacteroides johnsonii DSM 18315 TaxID=537006 RepID=B7B891_9BACT|nr:hypothetical protein PRABACTJOHN_01241 [Parabacteroides johnsonii DSM 18315]